MRSMIVILLVILSFANSFSQTTTFEKSYGKQQNSEIGKFLIEMSDQIYLAGSLSSSAILLYKLNSTGDTILTKSLPGDFDIEMPLKVVKKGSDFVLGATKIGTFNSLYLIRLNENIDTIWTRTFELLQDKYIFTDIINSDEGGLLTCGASQSLHHYIRLVKVSSTGDFEWQQNYDVTGVVYYSGLALQPASTSGYFLLDNKNFSLLDDMGNILWTHLLSFKGIDFVAMDDSNFIVSGEGSLAKIDLIGQTIWQKPIPAGYEGFSVDYKSGVGIFTIEYDYSNPVSFYYSHYDDNGDLVWRKISAGKVKHISLSTDDGLLISGDFTESNYFKDNWFLKTNLDGGFSDVFVTDPYGGELISPNSIYNVKWSTGYATNLKLEYSIDGGNTWQIVATDLSAESENYDWLVPSINADVFIKLTDQNDNSISDENNYSFIISLNKPIDYIEVNEVKMYITNFGMGSHSPYTDGSGFYWPKSLQDTTLTAIFEDGLVYGAKVNGEIRVNGDTYRYGLQPGKIIAAGIPDNPVKSDFLFWKVDKNWQSLPPGNERDRYEYNYNNWPVDLGAPFNDKDGDGEYTPGLDQPYIGDQTLFNVMNDLNPVITEYTYGSQPIGLEVQSSVFGFDREDELKNVVFKKYKIINKSDTNLEDMFLSYWADDDLGYASDDFVGCDTVLNLAYQYNGDNIDQGFYETPPPAVGHKLVQGPIVPATDLDSAFFNGRWIKNFRNLPLTAFSYYLNGNSLYEDPALGVQEGAVQFYNNMQGLLNNGDPMLDPNTGIVSKFAVPGDPVTRIGWYEGDGWPSWYDPGDRRYLLSSGPFNLAVGDTQEIVIAIMMAQGSDNINSISKLKNTAVMLQNFYESNFTVTDVKGKDIKAPYEFALSQNYPNPFNPSTVISYQLAERSQITLKVFDILGREVATLINEEKPAGSYQIEWDARNFASGVYLYRLNAGAFGETKKLILLK